MQGSDSVFQALEVAFHVCEARLWCGTLRPGSAREAQQSREQCAGHGALPAPPQAQETSARQHQEEQGYGGGGNRGPGWQVKAEGQIQPQW